MMHHRATGSTRSALSPAGGGHRGAGLAGLLAIACGGTTPDGDTFGGQSASAATTTTDAGTSTGVGESTGDVPTSSGSTTSQDVSSSSGDAPPECSVDEDCADHEGGPVCSSGQCTTPCAPGATKPCYSGPADTLDVGPCARGQQTCSDDGLTWSACEGEVLPEVSDLCANTVDDDCNGAVDDDPDLDGDGWGACAGDCCDADGGACFNAAQVNPGAYEYVGNDVDDDCDGEMDEVEAACDDNIASDVADPLAYARAIDLCTTTEADPADPKDRTWGVLSAALTLADGKGAPASASRSVRNGFGNAITPQRGSRLAVFSSGHAADDSDTNPAFAAFEPGKDMKTTSPPPADWLTANGGKLPNPMGCVAPAVPAANDPVMLTLQIRVPTNAKSFSAKMYFFSAEYPEWVCSEYNDFFVALVDSSADNPVDKNVAVYDDGMTKWPIGVNLALVADGLFRQCDNGTVGCAVDKMDQYGGCDGTAQLKGTGFDALDNNPCDPAQKNVGGGTGWLTLRGNVTPGETMTLRLAVWDSGGHIYDSLVLLDAWEWSVDPAMPGVTPG